MRVYQNKTKNFTLTLDAGNKEIKGKIGYTFFVI
jgi:hypothetical protein